MRTILILICLLPFLSNAQVTGTEIVKDPRLDLLIKKQAELNRKVYLDNNRTAQGFRILVLNTSDRNKAMDTKSRLMRDFPDHKTYLIYQSPHFKIQIGNFRTREDAEGLRKQINRKFTTGVIVIPSTIELKPEEDILLN
jgi:SPOR domain